MDAAAPRKNAGRIFARRKTGARRASNAMEQAARRDQSAGRIFARRRTGSRRASNAVWQGAPRDQSAGRIFARRKTGSRRASNAVRQGARRDHNVVRNNAPRRRKRRQRLIRGATTAGRAPRRCRERIVTMVCRCGRRRGHLWMLRRGTVSVAASLHAARPERDARSTPCDKARDEIRTSCVTTPRDAAIYGGEAAWGEIDRPGNEALPAGNRENSFVILARGTINVGRRTARSERRAQQCPVTLRATDAEKKKKKKKKSWGEIGRLGNKALPAENRDNGLNILVHCTGNLKAPR